jgi:EAL domain-containing protein (putative c-di-GMP-specific phosphodiesterase class I)
MVSSENYYINCGIYITDSRDHQYNRAITNAGYAKKLAKENGDGRCVWFDKDMFESRKREMQLLDEFPEALRLHQFEVFYQPQIDTISKTVVGAEALSRWIRDDGTIMMPDEFIPALENSNKMIELDYYVIETVFHFIGRQYGIMEKNIPISVNLSKKHITDPDFFPRLEAMLRKYQVDPQYIFFEINEEAFISQMKETVAFCNHLNMMGIEVMMDSFGSGYSSLNVLDKLPVAYIKIDRLFIKSNAFIKNEEIILNGIVDIAKKLRKSIASMGVETFEQNAFLCKCGCDIIQGNYYSEPLPEAELIEYIREHSEPEVNTVHFTFDGTFASNNTAEYKANVNGSLITFNDQLIPGRKVLEFPGGMTSHEMIELSLGRLLENDFTIGIWFNERRVNLWTSLFCADFANGFFSIMPKGWNGLSVLRVMDKENEEFFDAIGTDKEMTGWTHIAGAYNATTHSLALFVNGFLTGYKNDVMTLKNPGRITLGGDVYQQSFDGWIADLKVTNKTMSAKDVRQVYEQEKTAYLI